MGLKIFELNFNYSHMTDCPFDQTLIIRPPSLFGHLLSFKNFQWQHMYEHKYIYIYSHFSCIFVALFSSQTNNSMFFARKSRSLNNMGFWSWSSSCINATTSFTLPINPTTFVCFNRKKLFLNFFSFLF